MTDEESIAREANLDNLADPDFAERFGYAIQRYLARREKVVRRMFGVTEDGDPVG